MTPWEVISSNDDGLVFDANSVAYTARARGIDRRTAAKQLAREHEDPLTDEKLIARAVPAPEYVARNEWADVADS